MGKCEGERLNLRGFRPVTPDLALRRARDGTGRLLRVHAAVTAPSTGPRCTDWVTLMEKGLIWAFFTVFYACGEKLDRGAVRQQSCGRI